MNFTITKVPLDSLGDLRKKFLDEISTQFTYDKCHLYGWADTYIIQNDDNVFGYGSVWGKDQREDRDSIFEFYLNAGYRNDAHLFFKKFIEVSGVSWVECQSNDPFLSEMLFEFTNGIFAEAILFEDSFETSITIDDAKIQYVETPEASRFNKEYILNHHGQVVGKGGLMLNYNFPYADIYYGIDEQHRRKGYGSFFVQELKKEAYRIGRVPAARTGIGNKISKRTMMKAGLKPCGWRLCGKVMK